MSQTQLCNVSRLGMIMGKQAWCKIQVDSISFMSFVGGMHAFFSFFRTIISHRCVSGAGLVEFIVRFRQDDTFNCSCDQDVEKGLMVRIQTQVAERILGRLVSRKGAGHFQMIFERRNVVHASFDSGQGSAMHLS